MTMTIQLVEQSNLHCKYEQEMELHQQRGFDQVPVGLMMKYSPMVWLPHWEADWVPAAVSIEMMLSQQLCQI